MHCHQKREITKSLKKSKHVKKVLLKCNDYILSASIEKYEIVTCKLHQLHDTNYKNNNGSLSRKLRPRDCSDLPVGSDSGVYTIYPTNAIFDVYCDVDTAGFGWTVRDSLKPHNGRMFSTKDKDNDIVQMGCAQTYKGAWWYNGCHSSNLNEEYLGGNHSNYANGIIWDTWAGYYYSLKSTRMMIKRHQ
ncbi:unnamed protein product [Mytilus edulis]|uniref:Fibrinogen C-terminal domain-containing protein n=1 Tax=Mytilus edulis TaxID=6550 RepID=A0A8S3TZI1_MYTED|nr:unnamed protein product [Mytilus edulis]